MAHWAEINEDNLVLRVIVGSNDDLDEGYQWIVDNLGGTWLKTSYNTQAGIHRLEGTPFRKNFAQPGFTYDPTRDAFIPPMPETTFVDSDGIEHSWVLNETTCIWDLV